MNQNYDMKRLDSNHRVKRRFVTSNKAPIDRMVTLDYYGQQKLNTVRAWIATEPFLVYLHVYEPRQHGLMPLLLTRDGVTLLKEQLKEHHPELYMRIENRAKRPVKAN